MRRNVFFNSNHAGDKAYNILFYVDNTVTFNTYIPILLELLLGTLPRRSINSHFNMLLIYSYLINTILISFDGDGHWSSLLNHIWIYS